jgi:hypothetical protein
MTTILMADSLNRKPENNMPEEVRNRLAKYNIKPMEERTEPSDVPRWVKMAFTKIEVLGMSYKDAAAEFKRQGRTLEKYARAPIIKEWREQLREFANDPVAMATAVIRGSTLEAAIDQIWAIETAKSSGDYKEVRLGTKDILATHNVLRPASSSQRADGNLTISVNLAGALPSLEAPTAQAEVVYEEVIKKVEDYEIIDDIKTDWEGGDE